jgi:ArsR family transcriptional regulator
MAIKPFKNIDGARATRLGDVLKGLGHPTRLGIVNYLCASDRNVSELSEAIGAPQSLVSQHLAQLRMLGLVRVDRTGGHATYSIAEPRLRQLLECLSSCE